MTRLVSAHVFIPRMVTWFLECSLHPLLHVSYTRHLRKEKTGPSKSLVLSPRVFSYTSRKIKDPNTCRANLLHLNEGCPACFYLSPLYTSHQHNLPLFMFILILSLHLSTIIFSISINQRNKGTTGT